MMKRAFTLIEVNLAMLVMAGGVLSLVGLYSLGFRESNQSREDVAATAMADSVLSPLVMVLSATNVTWTSFSNIGNYPSDEGWGAYLMSDGSVNQDPKSKAESAFGKVASQLEFEGGEVYKPSFPSTSGTGMSPALVVMHDRGSAIVRLSFRAVREDKYSTLLAMPTFYTEVRFQGRSDK